MNDRSIDFEIVNIVNRFFSANHSLASIHCSFLHTSITRTKRKRRKCFEQVNRKRVGRYLVQWLLTVSEFESLKITKQLEENNWNCQLQKRYSFQKQLVGDNQHLNVTECPLKFRRVDIFHLKKIEKHESVLHSCTSLLTPSLCGGSNIWYVEFFSFIFQK